MKLHLGCGRRYLEGYVNIDFPVTEQSVQTDLKADIYKDITLLSYPPYSIGEIRLHHVFEHFPRPIALALLCRWRDWLKMGGLLRIETPDATASFKLLTSPFNSFNVKQQVMRHLFGSHEAGWAVHWDGWYKKRLEITLNTLGFGNLQFKKNKWGNLRNIEVFAVKTGQHLGLPDYTPLVKGLLMMSTIRVHTQDRNVAEGSEAEMLEVWLKMWNEAYLYGGQGGTDSE